MKIKKNTDYITLLSVLSAIAVVYLHAQFAYLIFSTDRYWITTNIIRGIFYFAVPIFFMISGATLLNYRERYTTKEFFKKRLIKVIIPFIIWSIIGLFIGLTFKTISYETTNIKEFINGILGYKYNDVYWYIPTCISVYLCMPLFSAVPKELRKEVFSYIAITCFIINILLPFFNNIFSLGFIIPINITVGTKYLFYVIIGYLLKEYELSKKMTYIIYILGIAGLLLLIVGTCVLGLQAGKNVLILLGYCDVPCILYSVSIFVFFKNFGNKLMENKKINGIVNYLGRNTFAIYLIHMYVYKIIGKLFTPNRISILYRIGTPIIVIIVCLLITAILRKIKYVKNIVPE